MSGHTTGYWSSVPLGSGVELLNEDPNGLAALLKPEGVLSQPTDGKANARNLVRAAYDETEECYHWPSPSGEGEVQRLWLLNRLDSATSGVILVATQRELAVEIRAQFKRKQVRKVYQAVVFGVPRQPQEIWRDMLAVQKKAGQIRTSGSGNIPCESRMSVVKLGRSQPRLALIRLEPRTGRSHQLRVQCAKRMLPIVGDQTYGNFEANRHFAKTHDTKRLFLHSHETSFSYEFKGRQVSFAAKAPLPASFLEVL